MTHPYTPAGRILRRLSQEWLLLLFAALTVVLAVADPQPASRYLHWMQLPTLAGLLGLLVAIQGIRDSQLVQRLAARLLMHTHSVRTLGVLLVGLGALLSMLLTNDVSLFLVVPLTLAAGELSNLPIRRMVVLEALAVNAGSTLSPIGNPQNLLLWQHAHVSFAGFARTMLPAAAVMLGLLFVLAWLWLPRERVAMTGDALDHEAISRPLALGSILALAGMVLAMEYGRAPLGALLLTMLYLLLARSSLRHVDGWLLLTFAAIFLGLGHASDLPWVQHAMAQLDFHEPVTLYASGIVASQAISNVPATVLLLGHAPDPLALAVAVNVGGFGLAIGSMANLIALRLARQPHGWRLFHAVSIPFLLVCAPLVYLLQHGI